MKTIDIQFQQNMTSSNHYSTWGASYTHKPIENKIPISTLFCLLEKPTFYKGYQNGYRQPVVKIILKTIDNTELLLKPLHQALYYYFHEQFERSISDDLLTCLAKGVVALQKAAMHPIFEDIQIKKISEIENGYEIWIPALIEQSFHPAMAFMLDFCHKHFSADIFQPNNALVQHLNELIQALKTYAPSNVNTLRFIKAAHHAGIPWLHVSGNTYQYGYGCHSRWFDSSFTENTSVISTCIARHKNCTTALLQRTGFPVPKQVVVNSIEEAVENAKQMGYPVVIKPYDQDGGSGVFAYLSNDEQVKSAFQQASTFSNAILLEQHVHGKDYRLVVHDGQLIWAIERMPAGITGDGLHSINELITKANIEKNLEITADTIQFLAEQGYQINSIPENGKFIPINRIANISAGGTPIAVFDKVHPDNVILAQNIAKLLRLDLAGIDFITPNIEESYLKVGGAVIEVNAQPQFGVVTAAHIYKQILTTLIPKQGRIPIIAICNKIEQDHYVDKLTTILQKYFKQIGLVKNECAFLNKVKICQAPNQFSAGESLLLNNQVDILIYCFDSNETFAEGLPFDQYDYLVLNNLPIAQSLPTLTKHCHHKMIINEKFINDIKHPTHLPIFSIEAFAANNSSSAEPVESLLKLWLKSCVASTS